MFYQDIPEILYHYCSIQAFFSIVNSKSLWPCNGLNMKDEFDSRYFEIITKEWLQKIVEQTEDTNKKHFARMCYEVLSNYCIERPVPFIASFSDCRDLLSQWITYANRGTGVCLGFNTEKLLEYSVDDPLDFLYPFNEINKDDILLINVEYSKDEIESKLESLLIMCINVYCNKAHTEDALRNLSILFCGAIFRNSAMYKHNGFREEHEWRLVSHCASQFSNSKSKISKHNDITFACINEKIKSHIILDLSKNWNDGLIQSVTLGPRFSGNEYDLKFFIDRNFKIEISIQQSNIPYIG